MSLSVEGARETRITPATTSTRRSDNRGFTKDRAKARWSILRNALLQNAQSSPTPSLQHSIHRFPGYQLLERRATGSADASRLASRLKQLRWDANESQHDNVSRLNVACLGVAAVSPKGQCVDIVDCPQPDIWFERLRELCSPSISLLLLDDKNPGDVTLLLQERSTTTNYTVYEYILDSRCSIWTREPQESRRLSLENLVSHRKTGVDNTGNVCVWDSERSLAHLLYHHYGDFQCFQQSSPPRHILELGTGMAGLAAVALGLRLVLQREDEDFQSNVQVTLTDGHPDGVLNNRINQTLTKLSLLEAGINHPYHALDISEELLLWTTDLQSTSFPSSKQQDVVLISDCTHFQEFHAALAITTLRSLRVGGVAIFCQPTRGDSLQNFHSLLSIEKVAGLATLEWWMHKALTEQDTKSQEIYPSVYDVDLHSPKILVVEKLRNLTEEDCQKFVHQQETRR